MIQNGMDFSPILGLNRFELQNLNSSIGLSLPKPLDTSFCLLIYTLK